MDKYVPKPDLEGINAPPSSPVRDLLFLGIGVLLILGFVCLTFAVAGEWAVSQMTPSWEKKVFSRLAEHLGEKKIRDPQLKKIFEDLKKHSQLELQLAVSCEKTPNAFAVPGGVVIVTAGLISNIKTEKGMAFVLAHEIGHFKHRHHLRGLGRNIGFAAGAMLLGLGDQTGITQSIPELMSRAYSRDQETQADAYALDLVTSVYGDASGATEFFDHIVEKQTSIEKWAQRSLMMTHPLTEERIANIKKREQKKVSLPVENQKIVFISFCED